MAQSSDTPRRGPGRPPFHGDRMRRIHFNLPDDLIRAVEERIEGTERSKSDVVREALTDWLARKGEDDGRE